MNYYTVGAGAESRITIEKSVFISNVKRVHTPQEAKDFLDYVRKKYSDATHNVYAYRLYDGTNKCSDDREPSGTAGVPVLEVIKGENLYDVIVVVTRYFGGVKLGTGGLARAYSQSAKEGISSCDKKRAVYSDVYEVKLKYDEYPLFLSSFARGLTEMAKEFSDEVRVEFACEHGFNVDLVLSEIFNKNLPIRLLKECYCLYD